MAVQISNVDSGALSRRGKTAIGRTDLSRPIKRAIADGIIDKVTRVFDYGCGLGDDIRRLKDRGYSASGWDPVHRTDGELLVADVVNLGYVINVIEDANERVDVLRAAWKLAEQVLVVSARSRIEQRSLRVRQKHADGWMTSRDTFQKFYGQQELRNWIEYNLKSKAVPAVPGVFYVFRDEEARVSFVASQYRRCKSTLKLEEFPDLFHVHRCLLNPLVQFVYDRGRVPFDDELSVAPEIANVFGSLKKAFRVIEIATGGEQWTQVQHDRSDDLLVYLALARFDGRSRFRRLPLPVQRDVRYLFGSYRRACQEADELLFSLGQPNVVRSACRQSVVGKLTPSALYFHQSAMSGISPLLRIYEGCGRGCLGQVEGANVIKLHLNEPMVSYLSYPDFDRDPHPRLASSVTIHLQTFRVRVRNYASCNNRPILHRKELFVAKDYFAYEKFARLTRIEESKGLYDSTTGIGFEFGWSECLAKKGVYLRGHRLLRVR